MTTSSKHDKRILIEGVTEEGKTFRPSDWAERVSGSMSTFARNRVKYSPLLQPTVNQAGMKCVLLDRALAESNPELYASILEFAKTNKLKICDEDDEPST